MTAFMPKIWFLERLQVTVGSQRVGGIPRGFCIFNRSNVATFLSTLRAAQTLFEVREQRRSSAAT
jgi:hypothetical protein